MFDQIPSTTKTKKILKPLSAEQLQRVVTAEIMAAIDFVQSEIQDIRILADKYYQGETVIPVVKGRSGVIVTKVRDGIKSVLPAIGRIFTQSDIIAEFSSDDEEDEQICQEQTLFVNSVYRKFGGYVALIQGCTDALKARVGIVKVTLEKIKIGSSQVSQELTEEEVSQLEEDDTLEITEVSEFVPSPPDGTLRAQVVMTRTSFRNKWHLDPIPPEQFFIDPRATTCDNARILGTSQNLKVYEAMAMGLRYNDLIEAAGYTDGTLDTERDARQTYIATEQDESASESVDHTARVVVICECWLRVDADGDGYAELRHIITAGSQYKILVDEVVNYHQFAVFSAELQPHLFFPICLAEDLMQDQNAQTALLRSIVDNTALVNSPRTEVNENLVNLEDVKSNEIGSIIRVKQVGQINELVTPFVAGQTLPVLEYLSQVSEQRSGITKLSQGIDPNALQSTSRIAANAAVQGGDARIEMMARNLGETGIHSMFLAILRTAMYELKGEQSIKTNSGYKDVQPDKWHDQVNVVLNVGMGNGRIDEKSQILQVVLGVQQAVIAQFGMANPVCGWVQARNTLKLMLRLAGIKSVGEFFANASPEQLQQMDQQAAQSKQQPDPAAGLVEAEKVKAQAAIQINDQKIAAQQQSDIAKLTVQQKGDLQKLTVENTVEMNKANMEDDRERDKQAQDYAVAAYKVSMDNTTKQATAIEVAKQRPKAA